MSKKTKILLINFGGIGDEILFLPTIFSLKKMYPNSEISLCLEPRSKSIKDLCPLIDDVICVDIKGKNKYFELLKLIFLSWKKRFDVVVSSGANKSIPILLFLMGIKKRFGYHSGKLSQLLLTSAVKLNKNQYAANMYHDLISSTTDEVCGLPHIETVDFPKDENSVLVHPGVSKMSVAKKMVKTFSPEKWADVVVCAINMGKKVSLIGGPDDEECISKIVAKLDSIGVTGYKNLFGTTKNICDLANLIKQSEILICSDSAPMHIGVAVGTKTLAVFGPTDEKKLLPVSENFVAIKNNCECRPCLWDKRSTTCETVDCLNISVEEFEKYL